MKKTIFIIVHTLAPLAHLNAMVLQTRNILSWADHDVLKDHDIFIRELIKAQQKNSCDSNGKSFLHALFAAELKDIQLHGSAGHSHGALKKSIVRKLFMENFDFNVTDKDGRTVLMLMAQEKDRYYNVHHGARDTSCSCSSIDFISITDLVKLYNADVNVPDKAGLTALMHAIKNDNTIAAVELIKSGTIKLDLQDANGKTALIHAIIHENDTIAELLIKQGASVNICDKYGGSALLYAVRNNHNPSMAQKLIELGANIKLTNRSTALLYVRDNEKLKDFITMFEKYYACYDDEKQLNTFLKDNPHYEECFFSLAALNDHHITLDCFTKTPQHMLAILERCAKWNRKGATEYALTKLIDMKEISPWFAEDKISFDERSLCCSLCCFPLLRWLMSHKTESERFLLQKLSTTYTVHASKTKRPFAVASEATIYKKAFSDFFTNYMLHGHETTRLLKQK